MEDFWIGVWILISFWNLACWFVFELKYFSCGFWILVGSCVKWLSYTRFDVFGVGSRRLKKDRVSKLELWRGLVNSGPPPKLPVPRSRPTVTVWPSRSRSSSGVLTSTLNRTASRTSGAGGRPPSQKTWNEGLHYSCIKILHRNLCQNNYYRVQGPYPRVHCWRKGSLTWRMRMSTLHRKASRTSGAGGHLPSQSTCSKVCIILVFPINAPSFPINAPLTNARRLYFCVFQSLYLTCERYI